MNVLIFAAGLGTRLKPLTDTMPKALVPVQGKPLLRILIEKLQHSLPQGEPITIVINVHHFANQITNYLQENDNFGLDIRISDERDMLLETGGGLKLATSLFERSEPILIHNVDILSDLNLADFYQTACTRITQDTNVAAVLEVSKRESSRHLLFDENNRLCAWTNNSTGEIKSPYPTVNLDSLHQFAFSGIHVVNPTTIRPYIKSWHGKFSIIDFYLSICDKINIFCEPNNNLSLVDVGKLETLDYLCNQNIQSLI